MNPKNNDDNCSKYAINFTKSWIHQKKSYKNGKHGSLHKPGGVERQISLHMQKTGKRLKQTTYQLVSLEVRQTYI